MQSTVEPLQAAFDKVVAAEKLLAEAADLLNAPLMGGASFKLGARASRVWHDTGKLANAIKNLGAPHVRYKRTTP